MILYHISTSKVDHPFKPRIPEIRMDGEDKTINRICVCDTLEGCFSAVPNGGALLDLLQEEAYGFYYVYMFDSKDISADALLTSKELYEKGLVEDAMLTGEHWILEEAVPFKKTVIYVDNWYEQTADVYPHEVSRLIDEEDMDIYEAMEKVCPDRDDIHSIVCIEDLNYIEGFLSEGEKLEFYYPFSWESFAEEMLTKSNKLLDLTEENMIQANTVLSLEEIKTWVSEYYS